MKCIQYSYHGHYGHGQCPPKYLVSTAQTVYWPHSCVPVWKVCLRPHRDHFHVSNIVTSVTLDKIINIRQTNANIALLLIVY